jgi:Transposase, Mutator family
VEVLCNPRYAEVTPERTNGRNGYRPRQLDTEVGSIEMSITKPREGSYCPAGCSNGAGELSGHWWRWWPSATGGGTGMRRAEGSVWTLRIEHLPKRQVSRMPKSSTSMWRRSGTLDGGPYTYVPLAAMTQKVRESGRIVNGRRDRGDWWSVDVVTARSSNSARTPNRAPRVERLCLEPANGHGEGARPMSAQHSHDRQNDGAVE